MHSTLASCALRFAAICGHIRSLGGMWSLEHRQRACTNSAWTSLQAKAGSTWQHSQACSVQPLPMQCTRPATNAAPHACRCLLLRLGHSRRL